MDYVGAYWHVMLTVSDHDRKLGREAMRWRHYEEHGHESPMTRLVREDIVERQGGITSFVSWDPEIYLGVLDDQEMIYLRQIIEGVGWRHPLNVQLFARPGLSETEPFQVWILRERRLYECTAFRDR